MVQGSLPGLVAAKVNECFEHNLHRFVMDIDQLKEEQKSKARDKAKVSSMEPGLDQCALLFVHLYWNVHTLCIIVYVGWNAHNVCQMYCMCTLQYSVCMFTFMYMYLINQVSGCIVFILARVFCSVLLRPTGLP